MDHDLGSDILNVGPLGDPFDSFPEIVSIAQSKALKPSKKLFQPVKSCEASAEGALKSLFAIFIHLFEQ